MSRSSMTFEQFLAWATPRAATAEGRTEVRRALENLVVYARGTIDEHLAQDAITKLGSTNFTEATLAELQEIGTRVSEVINGTQEGDAVRTSKDLELMREIAAIVDSTEGRNALNKQRAGAPLTSRERELVDRHDALLKQHNEIADQERPFTGGTFSTARPHRVAPELYAIERIADPREKAHAIRAQKAAWRDDPKSAYNDANQGDHKNAVEWMSRLYQEEQELGQPEDER